MFNKAKEEISFQDRMTGKGESLGKSLALRGLPNPTGDTLATYTAGLTEEYRSYLARNGKAYGGDTDKLAVMERENLQAKMDRAKDQLARATETERTLVLEKNEVGTEYHSSKNWLIHTGIGVFAVGEGVLSKTSMTVFENLSNVNQQCVLVLFILVYGLLPHAILGIYKETEKMKNRLAIRVSIGAIIIAGLYIISTMRSGFLANMGLVSMKDVKPGDAPSIPPLYWVGLNLLFIVIGCFLASLLESKSDRSNNNRAKGVDETLKTVREQIQTYNNELDSIPDRLFAIEQRLHRQKADSENLRQELNADHVACIQAMIASNLLWRTDHARCTCFDDPIPML